MTTDKAKPSISAKLRALGVKSGTAGLPISKKTYAHTIEKVLDGRSIETHQGEVFLVEKLYNQEQALGQAEMVLDAPLDQIAKWARDDRIRHLDPHSFAYIDTETTGLSGGTGTYAFLIGAGRFEGNQFHLAQFFLRDPIEEPAQLLALEEFLAPCQAIISFNGKAFDIPLLLTRYLAHGWRSPFGEMAHIDLLHLARRLWRDRLPSRTLGNLEVQILGTYRQDEDVPGWMIPAIYFDYLRDGDARPLKNVFYHNAMDVVSMSGLLNHIAALLSSPLQLGSRYSVDLISLASLFEDLNDLETATDLYIHGLEHDDIKGMRLPKQILLKALQRLALIYKRQKNLTSAIQLWEQAAAHDHLESYIELAKCYEHRYKDYPQAIRWTTKAIEALSNFSLVTGARTVPAAYQRTLYLSELEHRLKRLQRKNSTTS